MRIKLTKRGRSLMAWLKHWEISSQVGDEAEPCLTPLAKIEEKEVLALFRGFVRSLYAKKGD